jgi:hypothetical protein
MANKPTDLLGPKELAPLVRLTEATVRADASRRPGRLPPRYLVPGSNRLMWLRSTVEKWLKDNQKRG